MKKVIFPIVVLIGIFAGITVIQAKLIETRNVNISEQVVSINGIVADETNETLAGAVIAVNGQKVYTDLDGNFTLANLGGSKCELTVSMISYETQTIEMDLAKNKDVAIVLKKR
jgi:hypothetical protein